MDPRASINFFLCISFASLFGCAISAKNYTKEATIYQSDKEFVGAIASMVVRQNYSLDYQVKNWTVVSQVMRRLTHSLGEWKDSEKNVRYSFSILDSKTPLAFTVPGRRIYISNGMIELIQDEDQLAALLAHEIGHNVLKHYDKLHSKIRLNPFNFIFSQSDESDSDLFGIDLMVKAGYNPQGMVGLMKGFARKELEWGVQMGGFLESHPSPDSRADAAWSYLSKEKAPAARIKSSAAFTAAKKSSKLGEVQKTFMNLMLLDQLDNPSAKDLKWKNFAESLKLGVDIHFLLENFSKFESNYKNTSNKNSLSYLHIRLLQLSGEFQKSGSLLKLIPKDNSDPTRLWLSSIQKYYEDDFEEGEDRWKKTVKRKECRENLLCLRYSLSLANEMRVVYENRQNVVLKIIEMTRNQSEKEFNADAFAEAATQRALYSITEPDDGNPKKLQEILIKKNKKVPSKLRDLTNSHLYFLDIGHASIDPFEEKEVGFTMGYDIGSSGFTSTGNLDLGFGSLFGFNFGWRFYPSELGMVVEANIPRAENSAISVGLYYAKWLRKRGWKPFFMIGPTYETLSGSSLKDTVNQGIGALGRVGLSYRLNRERSVTIQNTDTAIDFRVMAGMRYINYLGDDPTKGTSLGWSVFIGIDLSYLKSLKQDESYQHFLRRPVGFY